MALAKQKPLYDPPTDYEDDFYLWCFEQAELLRQKRFAEVDLPNVIEELESMGRSDRNALTSSYRLLIAHLLKHQFQPARRSRSWVITIVRERSNIELQEKRNPSLKADAGVIARDAYPGARKEASVETGLPKDAFPAECPYTLEQLRSEDWMPE
jgi:hypothetical protein